MASGCKKEAAARAAAAYIKTIEKYKTRIRKNFEEMDLENADIRDRFEEIIKSIEKECNDLISYIEGVRFN